MIIRYSWLFWNHFCRTEVGIHKREQVSKKTRTRPRKRSKNKKKKKTRTRPRKRPRKTFFLSWSLSWSSSCFLSFFLVSLFSYFLTFFYKFSSQVEGLMKSSSTCYREAPSIDYFVRPSVEVCSLPFAFIPQSTRLAFFLYHWLNQSDMNHSWTLSYIGAGRIFISINQLLDRCLTSHSIKKCRGACEGGSTIPKPV